MGFVGASELGLVGVSLALLLRKLRDGVLR